MKPVLQEQITSRPFNRIQFASFWQILAFIGHVIIFWVDCIVDVVNVDNGPNVAFVEIWVTVDEAVESGPKVDCAFAYKIHEIKLINE